MQYAPKKHIFFWAYKLSKVYVSKETELIQMNAKKGIDRR